MSRNLCYKLRCIPSLRHPRPHLPCNAAQRRPLPQLLLFDAAPRRRQLQHLPFSGAADVTDRSTGLLPAVAVPCRTLTFCVSASFFEPLSCCPALPALSAQALHPRLLSLIRSALLRHACEASYTYYACALPAFLVCSHTTATCIEDINLYIPLSSPCHIYYTFHRITPTLSAPQCPLSARLSEQT